MRGGAVIALIQRVTRARVTVDGDTVGSINPGLLVLVGMERGDGAAQADRMVERLLGYRVFADDAGRMNRSVADAEGGVLLVPNFTLAADTDKGTRASFTPALAPEDAAPLFDLLLKKMGDAHPKVAGGRFGAHMAVELINDGPVTFLLKV